MPTIPNDRPINAFFIIQFSTGLLESTIHVTIFYVYTQNYCFYKLVDNQIAVEPMTLPMNLPSIYGQKMKVFQMMNGLALSSY